MFYSYKSLSFVPLFSIFLSFQPLFLLFFTIIILVFGLHLGIEKYTDIKEKPNFPHTIYKEIQGGEVAKSYMRKGFLIYE
jgi:hypothetical protein